MTNNLLKLVGERVGLGRPRHIAVPFRPFDPARPVLMLHVPKTGGTALRASLIAALEPAAIVGGFDRCLFGGFAAFDTIAEPERRNVYRTIDEVPRNGDLVASHLALSTLLAAYPTGQLVITLREPTARLLSHWAYWRGRSDADLAAYGAWADTVRTARAPLREFLDDPRAACQTDNVAVRMLLWPHPSIPDDGFIDPAADAALIEEAHRRLSLFAVADITEGPPRARLQHWLGRTLTDNTVNRTNAAPAGFTANLADELTPVAMDRMERATRLDTGLWRRVAETVVGDVEALRCRALLRAVAHHAALLAERTGGSDLPLG